MSTTRLGAGLVLLVALARSAHANVCVTIDESRDTLVPEDRRAAALSLAHALAKNGRPVTNQGCAETYTVYHVKLGDTISVYLYGPQVTREGRASKLDELPLVYEQLVAALLTGQSTATGGGTTVDRSNATNDQMVPRRVAADNVKFFRLGYGGISGHGTATGPAFGVGWRFELDRLGIEISAFDLIWATDSDSRSDGFTGSWIRLAGLYFMEPLANNTTYLGAGLSWGGSYVSDGTRTVSGSGLQGGVTAGYEMLRASTIRVFVELSATLPFYESDGSYTPSVVLQMGLGYGKANTIGVVNR